MANSSRNAYSNDTINFLLNSFYVDDGLYSAKTVEDAWMVVNESITLCSSRNLHLHKFVSNNINLLNKIPESERAASIHSIDLTLQSLPIERAVGSFWDTESDSLQFNVKVPIYSNPPDRRSVLSIIASVYDPLGFIAPFVLSGKMILQQMCREDVTWNQPLPVHLLPRWKLWLHNLTQLSTVIIPRCFVIPQFGKVVRRELHHFSDASTMGYGQCTYLKQINEHGDICCSFVIGKARVTPLKMITIPRLDLTAALLSIKISKLLKTAFKYQINEEYFWTDSTIVLCYLKNDNRRFMTYVANRIEQIKEQIKENITVNQWHYVASESNPSDHASRSLDVKSLITSNWFNGPSYLSLRSLPDESQIDSNLSENDQEVRAQVMQTTVVLDDTNIFDRFSSWFTAVRVISNCLKFKELLKKRLVKEQKDTHAELDAVEQIERSKLCIIRCLQRNVYYDEIQLLRDEKHIPTNNKLASLDQFLDNDGLLRVGGRLTNSSFMYGVKHPLIMPASSHVTRMLIGYYHEKTRHQGRGLTMNAIRTSGIWIIDVLEQWLPIYTNV